MAPRPLAAPAPARGGAIMTSPAGERKPALLHVVGRRLVLACGMAATLASAVLVSAVLIWASAESRRELAALAALLAESAAPALVADNPAQAQRALDTLRASRAVTAAAVYRLTGGPWVQFRQPLGEAVPASTPATEGHAPDRGEETLRIRSRAGTTLGWVWLQADPERQQRLVVKCLGFALLAVLISVAMAAAFAVRWNGHLLRPLDQIRQVSERIASEENLAVRARHTGAPEFEPLVAAFNQMLGRIQARDGQLRHQCDQLGELLAQRTAELAQLTAALKEARADTVRARQAKTAFLSQMSHELRTPLTAVIGFSEMLMEEAEATGSVSLRADLERIQKAGQSLLGLINEMIDLAKIEAGELTLQNEQFDVLGLANELFAALQTAAELHHNRLLLEATPNLPPMQGDRSKLHRTLRNLLDNALKFTERGEVRLRITPDSRGAEEQMVFEVCDNGIGMSTPQLESLFQAGAHPEAGIRRKFGGPGLGVAISRQFVRAMGGELAVRSETGRGTSFTVRLPLHGHVPPAPARPLPEGGGTAGGRSTVVLVIDDDPNTRALMVRYLTKEGFTAHTAANGREGIELARTLLPALITLDVMMPEVDGWTVLSMLKADPQLAGIPVVMLTMVAEPDKALPLGASEFLTKPVDFKRLSALLHRYCPEPGHRPILIVEDDEISSHLLRRNLEREGFTALVAADGRAALDLIQLHLPALILLDLMMPEMDGFEFAEKLRSRKGMADVPVVVLTAKELTEEDRQRLRGNVTSILQKQNLTEETLHNELRIALALHFRQQASE